MFPHYKTIFDPPSSSRVLWRRLADRTERGLFELRIRKVDVAGLGSKHSSMTCAEHTDGEVFHAVTNVFCRQP